MKRFENGDAVGVYTTVLLMRTDGKNYISFDGVEWEEIESELIDKQI